MSYLYSFVAYICVSGSESITKVREERANLSAIVYLYMGHNARNCPFRQNF